MRKILAGIAAILALAIFSDDNDTVRTKVASSEHSTGQQNTTVPGRSKIEPIVPKARPAKAPEPKQLAARETASEPQTVTVETRTVTASSLRARSGPSTADAVVGSVAGGVSVVVLGRSGDWLNVSLPNGRRAWMHGDYLSDPTQRSVPTPAMSDGRDVVVGRASVTDGDTIVIRGERIRLQGIDTPESGQTCESRKGTTYRCGTAASRILAKKIGRGNVSCVREDVDRYGRTVGTCSLTRTGENLQAFMVASGFALAYRKYSKAYVGQERQAKRAKRGMWQGRFVAPWDWRRGERLERKRRTKPRRAARVAQASKPTGECRIKGNISRSGRIYHVPGSTYYSRTKISPGRGERWFCSVREARAAGWRAPRR